MSTINYTTLAAALSDVPDPRSLRGQCHEWRYLLIVITAALMTGERTLIGISDWVQQHGVELKEELKPAKGRIPSLSTLRRALCQVTIEKLEAALGKFQVGLDGESGGAGAILTQQGEMLKGQSLDGKTVRGASAHGELVHLVSLVRHESGMVLDEDKATVKLHERKVAEKIFERSPLQKTVTTVDALHTSRKQAQQIRQAGGDYLMVVKRNQRTLYDDIGAAFTVLPPKGSCEEEFWQYEKATVHYRGHGRTETYTLESTTALNQYLSFPDVAQVVRRTRSSLEHSTQEQTVSFEYLITSLPRDRVSLEQIDMFRRWHWTIENVTHYPRDESFGEDRSQIRSGNAPQALAALRNAVASLLRIEGWPHLPNGFRYCRRLVQIPLRLMGAIAT